MVEKLRNGAVYLNNLLDSRIKEQLDPDSDVNRKIGTVDTVDGKEVYWSGQNYGWQSKASYEKLKEGDEFKLGHIAASRLESSAGKYIGKTVDALPEPVKEKGAELIQGAVDTYQSLPEPVQYVAEGTVSNLGKINQAVSDATNTSPIITGELLALGAGPALKTAKVVTKKGAISIVMRMDAPPAYGLTVTNPDLIAPGVRKGIGQSDRFGPGVAKLRAQGAADEARRAMYMEQFATGEITKDQLTERLAKVKKRGDAKYSTLATEDDPDIFEVRSQQNLDPTNPSVMADQHHAATKAMTTPWVRKALELGDDDDVVALFELHRMLTGSGMGNVKSGIIDIPGVVHDTAKASKAGRDPKQAIHSLFKKSGAGIEIRTDKVQKIIGNPKNMDELLDRYVTFANEYLIPQKELSLKVLNKELNRHRNTLSGDALKDFDLMVKKLNRANTK